MKEIIDSFLESIGTKNYDVAKDRLVNLQSFALNLQEMKEILIMLNILLGLNKTNEDVKKALTIIKAKLLGLCVIIEVDQITDPTMRSK